MKNFSSQKIFVHQTNCSKLKKHNKLGYYTIIIICCLLLNLKSNAQSYSISTAGTIPDSSAMLDIISSNKGLLIPRVELLSVTDSATIPHPEISLQVYNKKASMTGGGIGFWYWDGTKWIRNTPGLGADSLVIGSGTSSHLYNLQVTGTAGVTSSLTTPLIVGGSGAGSTITYKTTTGSGTTDAHIFKVGTNGATEAMRILNNGRIGIGTASPNEFVEINGGNVRINNTNGGEGIRFRSTSGTGNKTALYFVNNAGTEKWRMIQDMSANGTDDLRFTSNNNSTNVLALLQSGNVGIGTTTPASKLDVEGGISIGATYSGTTAAPTNGAIVEGDVGIGTATPDLHGNWGSTHRLLTVATATASKHAVIQLLGGSGAAGSINFGNQTIRHSAVGSIDGSHLGFYTNNSNSGTTLAERMRITSTGNIGIGTSSPASKFDVEGGVSIGATYSGTTAAPTNGAIIEGNVGIGTSSPAVILHSAINSSQTTYSSASASDIGLAIQNTNSTANNFGLISFLNSGNGGQVHVGAIYLGSSGSAGGKLFFSTRPAAGLVTERMRIDENGNVGIGTTSPGTKLEVAGQVKITGGSPGSGKVLTSDAVGLATWADGAANSTITNDASTNATMYPVWVTANTGSLPLKVSSTKLSFNPSTGKLTATGDATINTLTIGTAGVSTNTAIGYQVLNSTPSGTGNVALGYQSLYTNTTGERNTATGYKVLYSNTTGTYNSAGGSEAMYLNTSGTDNVAMGYLALYNNTTGTQNTAIGSYALRYQQAGIRNMGIGSKALEGSSTPSNNTGNDNVAIGEESLWSNTSGSNNAALGNASLILNTTGSNNTAIGHRTGYTNTTGSNNTFLGYYSDVNASNYSNSTAIGNAATATASNYVRIGNSSVATIGGQVSWTTISDGRFKTNISDTDIKGLDFIMKLRPVSYNLNTRQYEEFITKNMPDSIKEKHFERMDFTKSSALRHNGFIAQEVELAAQASNYEFTGLHKPETDDDNYGLAYSEFVVPLIKAMQEQQQLILSMQQDLTTKKTTITALQNQLDQLAQKVQQLENK